MDALFLTGLAGFVLGVQLESLEPAKIADNGIAVMHSSRCLFGSSDLHVLFATM